MEEYPDRLARPSLSLQKRKLVREPGKSDALNELHRVLSVVDKLYIYCPAMRL
jgi:hypothetical protein